ncbi:MAG: type II secretion system protein, partial [Rhodanobacter sp.]
ASAAAMWARSKLDSAFVMEPLQPGTTQGRFDERFGWQLQVTPWQGEGVRPAVSVLQLYQLDLTVTWGATAHPRVAHFRTLRLGAGSAAGVGLSP